MRKYRKRFGYKGTHSCQFFSIVQQCMLPWPTITSKLLANLPLFHWPQCRRPWTIQPLNQFFLLFWITTTWNQRSNRESCLLRVTLEFVVLLLGSLLSRKALQCLKLLPITGRSYWNVLVNSRSFIQSSLLASN